VLNATVLKVLAAFAAILMASVAIVAVAHASPGNQAAPGVPHPSPSIPTIATSGPGIIPSPGPGGLAVAAAEGETLGGKSLALVVLPRLYVYAYPAYINGPDPAYPGTVHQISYAWFISNPTTKRNGVVPPSISFGGIPTLHIAALAFGAIPVTADLTLSQAVSGDQVQPLVIAYNAAFKFTLSGELTVRLANVKVDGISLNLAPTCTTVTPAILVAHGTNKTYNIFTGGSLSGDVTIPDFTGCLGGTGPSGPTEDLSPLFDGTISGTSNPTFLSQAGLGTFDPAKRNDCVLSGDYPHGCRPPKALPTITASVPVPTVDLQGYDPPAY